MKNEHIYVWVRVGDGDPEPAALEGEPGARRVTTIGCPDPFMIDEEECPCKLVYLDFDGPKEVYQIHAPENPITEKEADRLERKWKKYINNRNHGYAGFGRKAKK